jgi:uncharacterized membrane protein
MSTLAIILIIIAIIIALLLIAALFTANEYVIERDITINRPALEVFNYIKLLKNQADYNKWVMQDPHVKREYKGTDGTVGFVAAWDSDNKQVGKGEQEIIKITEGTSIDSEVRFIKPFEGKAQVSMTTEPLPGNQAKIKWVFSGIRNYPMKIMHLLLNLKKILGKDLETSLANLKRVLEK